MPERRLDIKGIAIILAYCRRFPDRCDGKIVERSTTIWWIQIKNAAGQVGWMNEAEAFDGKDALGR